MLHAGITQMVAALSLTATSRGQPNVSHRVASSPVGSGWQHREAIQSFMQSLLAPAEESTLGARPTETSSSETLVFLIITSDHCQAHSEAMVYSVREMISVELIRCRHKRLVHVRWWWWWLFSSIARILGECSAIHSPPALFLKKWISSRTLIPPFRPGSVHSGSAT